ncbi:hypothetical protein Dsin_029112 [Dipteronia sinensis]|uniref:Uncharacterized protein n=1 Tax=Dipteronia sinensis TaxID=43782 RepID=A0AAE0DV66_9ROSI|nr:hypothetical protein Dsin_029112 [Dipteronia sinensis]
MVEEEQIAHGGELIHGIRPGESQKPKDNGPKGNPKGGQKKNSGRGKEGRKDDDQKGNRTFKRQFHRKNGHQTSKCYQLRDYIKKLIREGHLKDMVLKEGDDRQNDPTKVDQDKKRPVQGEVQKPELSIPFLKKLKQGWDPIIFSEADAHGLEVKVNDGILVSVCIGHLEVRRVLIDKWSSVDILSVEVFDQLGLQRKDL